MATSEHSRDPVYDLGAALAKRYLQQGPARGLHPTEAALERLAGLNVPLPETGFAAEAVIRELDERASPATVLSTHPTFFGFVCGGSFPVATAAQWLATAWDQVANMRVLSPAAAAIEEATSRWLRELFGFDDEVRCTFVTGTTTADITALLAARDCVLDRHGWDVNQRGMAGAPSIKAVVSDSVHTTMLRALRVIGLGHDQIHHVPTDSEGRMRVDALPPLDVQPTIVCAQAGDVNSGAFDQIALITEATREAQAWCHIDGAFGLWAAASPRRRHLLDGSLDADSWATDAHKWLNVPYDSGLCFFRHAKYLRRSLALSANYLVQERGDPMDYTLEASRRARGVEVWATLRYLGRSGVARLIDRHCELAQYAATRLTDLGCDILNDVVLNQVLIGFETGIDADRMIQLLRDDGASWFSGSAWNGRTVMRMSICNWATTVDDIDRSIAAIGRCLDHVRPLHNH